MTRRPTAWQTALSGLTGRRWGRDTQMAVLLRVGLLLQQRVASPFFSLTSFFFNSVTFKKCF